MKKPENSTIDLLWHSFLNGDDKSFAIIYHQQIHRLLSYGYKLSSNRELVQDCLQDVFIDLYLKRKKLNLKIRNLKAYLYTALRNCILKKLNKNRKTESIENFNDQNEVKFNVEYSFLDQWMDIELSKEIKDKLISAIVSLPQKQKEIIYLKFEGEMEYEEISRIMKITIESARKLMYRSLLSLRKTIDTETILNLFIITSKKY